MSAFATTTEKETAAAPTRNDNVFRAGDQLLYYNADHRCRYHLDSVIGEAERELLSEADVAFVHDYLYQEDLLCVFREQNGEKHPPPEEIDYDALVVQTEKLFVILKDFAPFQECMRLAAASLLSEDMDVGLLMLYAFDYMHLTHACVSQFLVTGTMEPNSVAELHRALLLNH